MIRGFRQIASLTFISRIFGMLRDIAYSSFFGANGLSDAWFIAFKIPNLARRLFGEGAASASFIPVYSDMLQKDKPQAAKLANTVVTVIFVFLSLLVIIGWAGILVYKLFIKGSHETDLILSLCSVMLPYTVMICTVAILAGILNVHRHFAAPAAAPIVLNVFIISAVLLTGWVFQIQKELQLFVVAFAVLAAGVTQLIMQLVPMKKAGVSLRPQLDIHCQAFKRVIVMMAPMIIGLTATQLNTLADDLIAWFFSGSDEKGQLLTFMGNQMEFPLHRGSVTHLYLAQRLYQLPLGVIGISLATAIFPVMSEQAAREDKSALSQTIAKGVNTTVFIGLPAMVGLFLVARPLIVVMFERNEFMPEDSAATAYTLLFYAIGLTGFFAQQVLTRAFYSMHKPKVPTISAVAAVIINVILNLTLVWRLGTGGLALSTAVCSYLQVVFLLVMLKKDIGIGVLEGVAGNLVKSVTGCVIMGLCGMTVVWGMQNLPVGKAAFFVELARVVLIVAVCIVIYAVIAKILKNQMLSIITGTKKR